MTLPITASELVHLLQHQTPDTRRLLLTFIKDARIQRKDLVKKDAYLAEKCGELCYHIAQAISSTPDDGHSRSQHRGWAFAAAQALDDHSKIPPF